MTMLRFTKLMQRACLLALCLPSLSPRAQTKDEGAAISLPWLVRQ
jgi:hypothetical protein